MWGTARTASLNTGDLVEWAMPVAGSVQIPGVLGLYLYLGIYN